MERSNRILNSPIVRVSTITTRRFDETRWSKPDRGKFSAWVHAVEIAGDKIAYPFTAKVKSAEEPATIQTRKIQRPLKFERPKRMKKEEKVGAKAGAREDLVRVARYYNNVEVYFIKNVLLTGQPRSSCPALLFLFIFIFFIWQSGHLAAKNSGSTAAAAPERKRYGGASVDLHWQMYDSFWASKSLDSSCRPLHLPFLSSPFFSISFLLSYSIDSPVAPFVVKFHC